MDTTTQYDELWKRGKQTLYQHYVRIMQELGYRAEPYARVSRDTMIFHITGYQKGYKATK